MERGRNRRDFKKFRLQSSSRKKSKVSLAQAKSATVNVFASRSESEVFVAPTMKLTMPRLRVL